MKKFILSVITLALFAPSSSAFNALNEHNKYRSELNSLADKQYSENQKYLLYYKGPANYTGASTRTSVSSGSKKDIYVKKGVKFKVDEAKQEQRLKEVKAAEEKDVKKETPKQTEPKKAVSASTPVKSSSKPSLKPSSKPAQKPKLKATKPIQKPHVELPKVNVNMPVKNAVKSVVQKKSTNPEPVQIPLNGKNADAE